MERDSLNGEVAGCRLPVAGLKIKLKFFLKKTFSKKQKKVYPNRQPATGNFQIL